MHSAQLADSKVSGDGGAVYVNEGGTLTLDSATAQDNEAANGGGVFVKKGSLTVGDTARFTSNTASGNGGALYYDGGSSDQGVTLNANALGAENGSNSAANGGGLYLADGNVTLAGNAIHNNSASSNGGGVYVNGGTLNLTQNAQVASNTAGSNGGGMYVNGGTLNLAATAQVANNTANGDGGGGGIYAARGTVSFANGAKVTGNHADNGNGGGMYYAVADGNVTLPADVLSGSNQAANGGGLYLADGTVTLNGNAIHDNTATTDGGGAYVARGQLVMGNGSSITGNSASGNGTGVYLSTSGKLSVSGKVNISGNTVSGNNTGKKCDVYLAAGAQGNEIVVTGNMDGSSIGVYAADADRDGNPDTKSSGDGTKERFATTSNETAENVTGLSGFSAQNVGTATGITGAAGEGNAIIWMAGFDVTIKNETTGDYADTGRKFSYKLTLPAGVEAVTGSVYRGASTTPDGEPITFDQNGQTFELADGDSLVLNKVLPSTALDVELTDSVVSQTANTQDGKYHVTAAAGNTADATVETTDSSDVRKVTITPSKAATITFTNTLESKDVPATGIGDNTGVWGGLSLAAAAGMAGVWAMRRKKINLGDLLDRVLK